MSPAIPTHSDPRPNDQPEVPANNLDPKQALDDYDWESLEARYLAQMEAQSKEEEEIGKEFRDWVKVSSMPSS